MFNQVGDYAYTLPNVPGTLATTANVATETNRATAAELGLTTGLGAETTRATTAEAALTTALGAAVAAGSSETSRAEAEEVVLTAGINAETTRAILAEAAVGARVTTETTRAELAENVLTTAVANILAATGATGGSVTAETVRAEAAEASEASTRAAAIAAEASTRATVDANNYASLASALTGETNARAAAVNAETARAEAAESGMVRFANFQLATANGGWYDVAPNGVIEQSVNATVTAGGNGYYSNIIALPVAFPNACTAVVVSFAGTAPVLTAALAATPYYTYAIDVTTFSPTIPGYGPLGVTIRARGY